MRERVEAVLGDDCERRLAVHVSLALRAAAPARGAAHRVVARLRHLRLVRPGRGGEAGVARARHRRQAGAAAHRARRGSARRRTAWRGRTRCAARGTSATSRSPRSTRSTSSRCSESNALDFDDLLLKTVELFETSSQVRERYGRKFKYVMVDEYQDTNRPQYMLIKRLAEIAPQPRGRRRSRPVDLQVARRGSAEHPRLRDRLRRRAGSSASSRTTDRRRSSSTPPPP